MSRPDVELSSYRYPEDWPEVAADVRARAGDRCECRGECGSPYCNAPHQADQRCKMQERRHFPRHAVVALDHNPEHAGNLGDRPNLRAFCPACADSHRYGLQRAPGDPGALRRPAPQTALDL